MALLKKLRASTLMETLVASVLIIIIFMIAGFILNNIFSNSIKNSTHGVQNRLNELQYNHIHDNLELPYSEDFGKWQISISKYLDTEKQQIEFVADNKETKKSITITDELQD